MLIDSRCGRFSAPRVPELAVTFIVWLQNRAEHCSSQVWLKPSVAPAKSGRSVLRSVPEGDMPGRTERQCRSWYRAYFRPRCHEPSQPLPGGVIASTSMRLMNAVDGPSSGTAESAASKA